MSYTVQTVQWPQRLLSCPSVSALEGLSGSFLVPGIFWKHHSNYWFILQRHRDWVGASTCRFHSMCSRMHQPPVCVLLRQSRMFHCRNCFLPIKQALISIRHNACAEGLRGSRLLSLQCAEQTRLLCLHEKKVDCSTSELKNPNNPVAVVGAQQM